MDPVEFSRKYGGKIQIIPKVPLKSYDDFSIIYTPGVAQVSKVIEADEDRSFELTSRGNMIAVLTNGTRVLGLGPIGPTAGLPVMEGKALLYKFLGGVDAVPLAVKAETTEDMVRIAEAIQPSFGGINLEDIESPMCFEVWEKLLEKLKIPVWHDDQHGTAGAILAGLINAMKLADKKKETAKVVLFGAGAANIRTAYVLIDYGFNPKNIILIDSKGPLYANREDVDKLMFTHKWKYDLAVRTNGENAITIEDAFKGADILVAASKPGPGTIDRHWIMLMNDKPIAFLLANPVPEMMPEEAKEAGAYIVATGRSDFPNQVNNSLVFPAVFRGVLDSKSSKVDDQIVIAAAEELARQAEIKGINPDYIIPRMDEWEVFIEEAASVADASAKLGYARVKLSKDDYRQIAKEKIESSRKILNSILPFIEKP
ncbi:MAG: NAD(P)-dependent malic enzyme [Nitrososphaeria archaeon]|nr:NADP-dependent malic enzyme [Conexivisphaerales archaeon]